MHAVGASQTLVAGLPLMLLHRCADKDLARRVLSMTSELGVELSLKTANRIKTFIGENITDTDPIAFNQSLVHAARKGELASISVSLARAVKSTTPIAITEGAAREIMLSCRKQREYMPVLALIKFMSERSSPLLTRELVTQALDLIPADQDAADWHSARTIDHMARKSGIQPDAMMYNALIRIAGQARLKDQVVELVKEVRVRGIMSGTLANCAILAFGKCGDMAASWRIFNEFIQAPRKDRGQRDTAALLHAALLSNTDDIAKITDLADRHNVEFNGVCFRRLFMI